MDFSAGGAGTESTFILIIFPRLVRWGRALILAFGTVTGSAWGAPAEEPAPWTPNRASWMDQLRDEIGSRPLREIALPGTHDSLTYDLIEEAAPDIPFDPGQMILDFLDDDFCFALGLIVDLCGELKAVADIFSLPIIFNWSITQQRSVRQQLNDGIRSLDFRFCLDGDGDIRGCHALFTQDEADVFFAEIKSFLDANPNEFIHLLVRAVSAKDEDWPADKKEELIDLMHTTFGSLLITDPLAHTIALNDLWLLPGRIFAINTGGDLDEVIQAGDGIDNFIHSLTDTTEDSFANTIVPADLRNEVEQGLITRDLTPPGKLLYSQTQMTLPSDSPAADEVIIPNGLTWMIDQIWDSTLQGQICDTVPGCWTGFVAFLDSALGAAGFSLKGGDFYGGPWGILDQDIQREDDADLGAVDGQWARQHDPRNRSSAEFRRR